MSSLPFPTSLDSAKLNWAFKLYDVDNDGMIDLQEMSVIMETLDSIEGIKPGNVCRESLVRWLSSWMTKELIQDILYILKIKIWTFYEIN